MICFECIENKDCIPSAFQIFYEQCPECDKLCTTIAYPIKKKENKE